MRRLKSKIVGKRKVQHRKSFQDRNNTIFFLFLTYWKNEMRKTLFYRPKSWMSKEDWK